jgi:DNA polymerase delta subunit 1
MLSGIPASNYSHVSYFPSRENYDEFYGFVIRVVNIAFEKFATCVQALLVKHLRTFGDKPAEWYEEWWTGARGRYCLCHCMHGGTNNNMGVKALHKTEEDSKSAQAHVILASKMKERDPNTAPVLGDRVPYVIVKGVKGAKAFEKAEDPTYVLEHSIPIDVQHYLDHHLSQPILRLFEAIMDRPQSLLSGDHTRQISMATPTTGGLMKFVSVTLTCLGCRTPLKAGQGTVCDHCRKDEGGICRRTIDHVSSMQAQFARLWTQCQRCQGSLHQEVLCTSRDCPIFYRRSKAHKDLLDAQKTLERFASW